MGVLALRIGRGPANKSCSWQWVYKAKFYFWGFTSPLGPKGSPTPKGVFALPSSAVLKPAQAGLVTSLNWKPKTFGYLVELFIKLNLLKRKNLFKYIKFPE
jgi:hypothetical protein